MELKHQTSEEKLLHVLRKRDRSAQKNNPVTADEPAPSKSGPSKRPWKRTAVLLVLVCVSLVMYSRYRRDPAQEAVSTPELKTESPTVSSEVIADLPDFDSVTALKPYEVYAAVIERRDLFAAPWETASQSGATPAAETPMMQVPPSWKLTGILLDQNPQAVIEDNGTQETFFLSIGDKIGDATVESIHEAKVILRQNDRLIELAP